jgi:CubicO group peptidase (beta-lactamase class C family)
MATEVIFDWPAVVAACAAATPWWEPNSAQGYSPFIYGWILGELVRRVSGYASFGEYFTAQVAQPLALDAYFGVPEAKLTAIADTLPLARSLDVAAGASLSDANSASLGRLMKADPRGVTNRAFANPLSLMTSSNSQAWRMAQIPAANAHTSAKALAQVYAALAVGDKALLPDAQRALCWQQQSFAQDQVLGLPLRFGCGFMLSQADRADCRFGYGAQGFGHPGAGGSLGFGDAEQGLGFGYTTASMGQSVLIDARAQRLISATYQQLGVLT